jgi:hypothetical protein
MFLIYTSLLVFFENKFKVNGWPIYLWSIMLYCGATVSINGIVLVEVIILKLSNTLPILRYDQIMHIYGTIVLLLFLHKSSYKYFSNKNWLYFYLFLAVIGIGSIIEIFEYSLIGLNFPIGNYQGFILDLISNLIGATLGILLLILNKNTLKNKKT